MNLFSKLVIGAVCAAGFFGDLLFVLDQAGVGQLIIPTPSPPPLRLPLTPPLSPPPTQAVATPVAPTATPLSTNIGKIGKYIDFEGRSHQYSYIYKDKQYSIRFHPNLPKGDQALTGAMLEIIRKTYKPTMLNTTPSVVERQGHDALKLKGLDANFFFIPYKENNGDVWGMTYWIEKKK